MGKSKFEVDRDKLKSGGIYLIDQKGFISPEYGYDHYCILMKTNNRDMFLAFPLTTLPKRRGEPYTLARPNDEKEIILLNQVKPISKHRVIGKKTQNGQLVVVSDNDIELIFSKYREYLEEMELSTKMSVRQYNENKKESREKMKLKCVDKITVERNSQINIESLIIEKIGGEIRTPKISTKKIGLNEIDISLVDRFNQRITKKVIVEFIEAKEPVLL